VHLGITGHAICWKWQHSSGLLGVCVCVCVLDTPTRELKYGVLGSGGIALVTVILVFISEDSCHNVNKKLLEDSRVL
jgi:hypothetical protein